MLIVCLIVLGKLSGLLKDVLITFYHGVSSVTDAYFLSNSISSVLYMAIYSAVPILVVPLYSRAIVGKRTIRANTEISAALVFLLVISVCAAIFVWNAASFLVSAFSGNIDSVVKELATNYLGIMALTFSFSTLVSFYNSIQTVKRIVLPSYIVPIFNNSIFCIGLAVFSSASNFHSVLLLGLLSWILLCVVNFRIIRGQFIFDPKAALDVSLSRKLMLLFFPAALSFYIEQVNSFVGIYFASELGLGAISIISYSNKINLMFLSVFLVYLTASIFPRIAAVNATGEIDEMYGYLVRCLRLIVLLSVPIVGFIHLYSDQLVELLFLRGNFTVDNVNKVASVLSLVVFALPFCLIRDAMNRVIFASGNTLTPLLLSLVALAINVSIAYLSYKTYGLLGLAFASVVSTMTSCIIVTLLVSKMIEANLTVVWIGIAMISAACTAIAYMLLSWIGEVFSVHWIVLFFPYLVSYASILYILRVREMHMVVGVLRGMLGRL